MRKVIAVAGKKTHGKDTVADYFVANHGYTKVHFAKPLKDICMVFGFTEDQLYDNKEVNDEFWGITPRAFMKLVGTDMFRNMFDQAVWVKKMERTIADMSEDAKIVIADVRFDNERALVTRLGGLLIHVKRDINTEDSDTHATETGVFDDAEIYLTNNGTIEELWSKLEGFAIQHSE